MHPPETAVLSMRTEAPGIGSVTWVRSGRLYWLPELGTEAAITGEEYARREARLVERIRNTFGSSPYGPVTRESNRASELLAAFGGALVTRDEGPSVACRCTHLRELGGRTAEDYADHHLAYVGLRAEEPDELALYSCLETGSSWRLTYPGPRPHGAHEARLVRAD